MPRQATVPHPCFGRACHGKPWGYQCPNQSLIFDLQAENPGPSGNPALFYYRSGPDDWNNQYAFRREWVSEDSR